MTGKTVKCIRPDQGREFGVRDLEFWTKMRGIKVKYTVFYSPQMNGIAKQTRGLIAGRASCLQLDKEPEMNKSLWPEVF